MRRTRYQYTYKRKVALKKAQLASARKRKRLAVGVLAVGVAAGAVYAGRRVSNRSDTIVTFHHTTARGAELIMSPPTRIRRGGFLRNTRVWATTNKSRKSNVAYRGSTVLAITTKKNSLYKEMKYSRSETHYTVRAEDIMGIKIVGG